LDPEHTRRLQLFHVLRSTFSVFDTCNQLYHKSTFLLADFSQNIYLVIDSSVETLDASVWDDLKKLINKKNEAVAKAEATAREAL
jgi:hypothetical protein